MKKLLKFPLLLVGLLVLLTSMLTSCVATAQTGVVVGPPAPYYAYPPRPYYRPYYRPAPVVVVRPAPIIVAPAPPRYYYRARPYRVMRVR